MSAPTPEDGAAADIRRGRAVGWREFLLASLAFTVAVTLLYAPTLGGHYQADDFGQITIRTDRNGDPDVGTALAPFYTPVDPGWGWRFHRPLWGASFLLEAGPLAGMPWASRVLSIVLHAVGAALIAWILRRRGAAALPVYLAAAAFALGPASAQVVTWIVSRCDSMATTFGLAAVAARLVAHETEGARRVGWRGASLVALTAAIWSKESGYAFVPALVALEVLDGPGTVQRRLVRGAIGSLDIAVVAAALFLWRAAMVGDVVGGYAGGDRYSLPASMHVRKTALGMFPAGLIGDRTIAAGVIALMLAGLVALSWRSARSVWGVIVFALVLLAASIGATMHVPVSGYASPDSARINHQPAAAWAIALGAALAAGWSSWPRRGVRVAIATAGAAVTVLAVVANWPLVQGHAAAGRLAGDVVAALREVAREHDSGPVVLRGVPDKLGPGLVGRNLVGSVLSPVVIHPAPTNILLGNDFDAALPGRLHLEWLPVLLRGQATTRVWDPATRRFTDSEGWRALHVRGRVRRWRPEGHEGEPRLRLLGAPLELTGAEPERVLLHQVAAGDRMVEIVLDPVTELRTTAVVREVRAAPVVLVRARPDAEGAAQGPLVVRGPPGSRVLLIVGDRAGWRPLGELGTCLIDVPRLLLVGLVAADGRLEIELDRLRDPRFAPPRFVQALVTVARGRAWISERYEFDAADFPDPPAGG